MTTTRQVALASFYRGRGRGSGKANALSKVTKLVSDRAGIPVSVAQEPENIGEHLLGKIR